MKGKWGDILKTAGAVLIIGGIIVATFLYGNKQRVEQQQRDQQVRTEQEEKAKQQTASQPEPTPAPAQPSPSQPGSNVAGNVGGGVSGGQIPAAGGGLTALLGAGALAGTGVALRSSKRALRRALVTTRTSAS